MKTKLSALIFTVAALAIMCCSTGLEAKSRTRFGFGYSSGVRTAQPVYVAPVAQPVYVYPTCPGCYPVVYQVPAYQPVYVSPQPSRSTGFSFSWSSFWR